MKHLRGKKITLAKVVRGGPIGGSVLWKLESWMRESYPELFPLGTFEGENSLIGEELYRPSFELFIYE